METRLNKYLVEKGICSRRKADEYISAGYIRINGKIITQLGTKVTEKDEVIFDNKELTNIQEKRVYIAFNKPEGIETTCAQYGEKNIIDLLKGKIKERVFPIGRLDKNSSGLILLTNDGRLSYHLMHPKFEHTKEYVVTLNKPIEDADIEKMKSGIYILGKMTKQAQVKKVGPQKIIMILQEGRNRQIRRMTRTLGYTVVRLNRVRIENIELNSLKPGEFRYLDKKELKGLEKITGLDLLYYKK